jgi:hypothetical protein
MSIKSYGNWNRDESGLPCFDLAVDPEVDQDAPLLHLLGTGRLSALINRWGSLRCFTTAGGNGYLEFRKGTPWYGLSEMMGVVDIEGERYALFGGGNDVAVRYGTGYASFSGKRFRPAVESTAIWVTSARSGLAQVGLWRMRTLLWEEFG